MVGTVNKMIPPESCVLFVKLRSIIYSGVVRLMSLLESSATAECGEGSGIMLGADLTIIVSLNGTLLT